MDNDQSHKRSREEDDTHDEARGAYQKKSKSFDPCKQAALGKEKKPEGLEALVRRQRAHVDRVESGKEPGKELFDPWTERACDEYGKLVERLVDLATESMPEKPRLLGGGDDRSLEYFLRYTLFVSDHQIQRLNKGEEPKKVLSGSQYQQYQNKLCQSSQQDAESEDNEGTHSRSSQRDAESEDERSARSSSSEASPQRDRQPDRDEGTSSRYNEGFSFSYYSSNEHDKPKWIGCNQFFEVRYDYPTRLPQRVSKLPGACVINATITLLEAYGIGKYNIDNLIQKLGYPCISPLKGGCYSYKIKEAIKHFSNSSIEYQDIERKLDFSEMQRVLEKGPLAASFKHGYYDHTVVVEKVEDNTHGKFVCILDSASGRHASYKVPIDEWERVSPGFYCVSKGSLER